MKYGNLDTQVLYMNMFIQRLCAYMHSKNFDYLYIKHKFIIFKPCFMTRKWPTSLWPL